MMFVPAIDPNGPLPVEYVPATEPIKNLRPKIGRNKPCPCASGRKWKLCHLREAKAGKTGPILRDKDE